MISKIMLTKLPAWLVEPFIWWCSQHGAYHIGSWRIDQFKLAHLCRLRHG